MERCRYSEELTIVFIEDKVDIRKCCLKFDNSNSGIDLPYEEFKLKNYSLDDINRELLKRDFYARKNTMCNNLNICPVNTISRLSVSVRNGCNIKCHMCQTYKPLLTPNTINNYFEYLDSLKDKPIELLELSTASEPLILKNRIFKFLSELSDSRIEGVTITTNALLLNDEDIAFLKEINKTTKIEINVSCSATNEKTYKKIHCNDGFNKVFSNISKLKDAGLIGGVNYVICSKNVKQVFNDWSYFEGEGIHVNLITVRDSEDIHKNRHFKKLVEKYNELLNIV